MIIPVYNTRGEKAGDVELRSDIFEAFVNVPLMHQAFVRQMANARRGTHKTQSRGEVNRTTAKWYRQKGTGRARHGSRSANLFVGGAVAHGPKPRDYTKKMPRKMRRASLRAALSVKAREGQIVVVDALEMEAPKTKEMVAILKDLGLGHTDARDAPSTSSTKGRRLSPLSRSGQAVGPLYPRVLILLPEQNEAVEKSASNLPQVKTLRANYLNIRDLLVYDYVLMPLGTLQVIESVLGMPSIPRVGE